MNDANIYTLMKKITLFLVIVLLSVYLFQLLNVYSFIQILVNAIIPVLIGVFISFLFEPLIVRLTRYGMARFLACVIVYAVIGLLLFGMIAWLLPQFLQQASSLSVYLPELENALKEFQTSYFTKTIKQFHLDTQITNLFKSCCQSLWKIASHLLSALIQIGIGIGAAFYLSIDFKKVTTFYYDLAPKNYRKEYRIISKKTTQITFTFFRSLLYDSLIFFLLSTIALIIGKFPYPLILALILTITNLIPYVGPYIGMIPLVLIGLLDGPRKVLQAIVIAFGLQSVENNLVSPILLKNMIYLHPVIGIFGISFFGSLFGVLGMVFSPLLLSIIKIIYEELVFKKLSLEKNEEIVYNANEIDEKEE